LAGKAPLEEGGERAEKGKSDGARSFLATGNHPQLWHGRREKSNPPFDKNNLPDYAAKWGGQKKNITKEC